MYKPGYLKGSLGLASHGSQASYSEMDKQNKFPVLNELICPGQMSRDMRKPAFCINKNKIADQLCGNRSADQHLCFHYIDSTIPLLPKYKFSSL